MILTGLPQGIATVHPVETDQQILKREGQRVSHMKATGHIWRRHHDRVWLRGGFGITGKGAACFPALVPTGLDGLGIIGLGEFFI